MVPMMESCQLPASLLEWPQLKTTHGSVLVAGVAGLVAGAMSMAAGEYVSVSSQSDTERADLARERKELETTPDAEHAELASIYVARGLDKDLAHQVAIQLTNHDALGAHARDELGISDMTTAKPIQAALASAASFAIGALLPLLATFLTPVNAIPWVVSILSLFSWHPWEGYLRLSEEPQSGKPYFGSLSGVHWR